MDCSYHCIIPSKLCIQEKYSLLQKKKICRKPKCKTIRTLLYNPYDVYENDYNCVVYYKDCHEIEVIIMRIDGKGWSESLILRFDESGEEIEMGTCKEYRLEKVVTIQTRIHPLEEKKHDIPRTIIQTGKELEMDEYSYITNHSFMDWNPGYEYFFFNDVDCQEFLERNMKEVVPYYLTLKPSAYRADLFRYCFLYLRGGCYFDYKLICRKSIESILNPNQTLYLCYDWEGMVSQYTRLYNAVIITKPKHPLMKACIDRCIQNIKTGYYGNNPFHVTGPELLADCMKECQVSIQNIVMHHRVWMPDSYKNSVVLDLMSNQVFLNKSSRIKNPRSGEYHEMWRSRNIYLKL